MNSTSESGSPFAPDVVEEFGATAGARELPPAIRGVRVRLTAVQVNADLRDVGAAIGAVAADDRFKALAGPVRAALSAANPVYGIAAQAAQQGIELLANILGGKPDDQLGYYAVTYTNLFDDLGVGAHPQGGGTMPVGKVRLAYQIDAM